MAPPMVTPAGWIESGYLIRAGSVGELAERTGMAPGRLRTTLDRFNAGARAGRDDEPGRGSNAISRYYGDRRVRPNPTLGPVERPPFFSVRLYPGDVSNAGGVRPQRAGPAP